MIRVFAIATDSAGCFLYRLHWPLTHLNPDEFQIIWHGPEFEEDRGLHDVVVGQRIAGDNQAWLDLCEDPTILAVYEIDDDIIDVDLANEVPYAIFQPQREGTIRNIAAADVVTASTPHLAAKVRRWNDNVVVLPNCLPREWFDAGRRSFRGDGSITVGWAGSPFHAQDWVGVAEQLAKLSDPRIRLATIGADYMSPHVRIAQSTGWTTMDHYLHALDFDIGLAPLAPTEFNRSKSWAKLLEYGARGIPSVASHWGQYVDWMDGCGYFGGDACSIAIAPGSDYWAEMITVLCDDDDARAAMGAAARKRAEEFAISRQVHRWADVYRQQPRGA